MPDCGLSAKRSIVDAALVQTKAGAVIVPMAKVIS